MTKLHLSPEEREWLSTAARPLLGDDKTATTTKLQVWLEQEAAWGNRVADRVLTLFAFNGCADYVDDLLKEEDRGVIFITATHGVELPARYGTRKRAKNGTKERGWTKPFWWVMSRAQLEEVVAGLMQQSTRMGERAEALQAVLAAWDQCPDADTAGEVCERLGIDPREFRAA